MQYFSSGCKQIDIVVLKKFKAEIINPKTFFINFTYSLNGLKLFRMLLGPTLTH